MSEATLPFMIDTPEFRSAWDQYIEYRRQRRLPKLVSMSVQKQWDHLSKFPVEVAVAAIEESIRQNYQGIFPEKVGRLTSKKQFASLGALQMQLKVVEEAAERIRYPGGCAFAVRIETMQPETKAKYMKLLDERAVLRGKIEGFSQ